MEMTDTNNSCCASPDLGNIFSALDIRVLIDETKCTGCGQCGEVCPFGLPQPYSDGKYQVKEPDRCIECSACQRNCPEQAIILQEQKGCGCLWDARRRAKSPDSEGGCC
jgi:ferredoxin